MAKLTVSRIFDVALLAQSKIYNDIKSFIDYMNQFVDNVIRILTNGVTIKDNLAAAQFTIPCRHNKVVTVTLTKKPVVVFLGRQYPVTPQITSFAWDFIDGTTISVVPKFDVPTSTDSLDVTFVAFFE